MNKFYLYFACLVAGILSGLPAFAQEESEIKFSTAKVYGDNFDMWPKATSKADTIKVDWGDGNLTKHNIDPKGAPFFSRVSGKIVGDTIRIYAKLVKLDVNGCQLTSFSAKNQPLLENLILSDNQLNSENLDLKGAPNLTFLDLNKNQLTVFDATPFNKLEMFSANENPQLGTAIFLEGSSSLKSISMGKCDVSHFYPVNLPALQSLDLESGSLMDLEIANHYPNLSTLNISGNYISDIDLSQCSKLETLNVTGNQLTKLDISANSGIVSLFCAKNQLKELNLQKNVEIVTLTCGGNQLSHLDVSCLPKLARLNCEDNAIDRLDVSHNSYLVKIECKNNQLEFLDFAGTPALEFVDCRNNSKMTSNTVNYMFSTLLARKSDSYIQNLLVEGCNAEHSNTAEMNSTDMKWKTDVKGDGTAKFTNVNLTVKPGVNGTFTLSQPTEFGKKYQNITDKAVIGTPVKVTSNPNADYVFSNVVVNGRVINDTLFVVEEDANVEVNFKSTKKAKMVMDVTEGTTLSFGLMAPNNDTEITVDWGNGVLTSYVIGKKITRIDGKAAGKTLTIVGNISEADFSSYPGMGLWENNISSLTISDNEVLEVLNTYMNPVKTLNVSGCPNLQMLDCSFSELTELDVTKNAKLMSLVCYGNELQKLDVTKCPELIELNAKSNQLTEIDLTANNMLEKLDVQNNALTSIDVAHLTGLVEFAVANNKLTEINVANNKALHVLNVAFNALTSLDLSKNPNLGKLLCGDNNISALDCSHQQLLYYVNCENNKMSACALTDLYYSLNEYPALEEPSKTHTLWVRGTDELKKNDAEGAESIIAVGKGWKINAEGDGSRCPEAYVTILESENGSVAVFNADNTPVLSGTKAKKNSTLKVVATPAAGYRVVKVLANGKALDNGTFVITRATDVRAIFEVATGVEAVETAGVLVRGAKGGVKVVSEAPAAVTVYTIGGQQIAQQNVVAESTIALAAGTYVVKVQSANGTVSKVVAVF